MLKVTSKPLHVWVLTLMLLLFQAATLAHSHDEFTQAVDNCEICTHLQQFGNIAHPLKVPLYTLVAVPVPIYLYHSPAVAGVYNAHIPRAPPQSL